MAITNQQIIMTEMALRGIEEECHTFARWKQLGFSVKKGEKALFAAVIWKFSEPKTDHEGNESGGKLFMKKSHFFGASQVEPLKVKEQAPAGV